MTEVIHKQARLRQDTAARPTEKSRSEADGAGAIGGVRHKSVMGRPVGSKNKPTSLVPRELANEFLGVVKDLLPPEHYAALRDGIRTGKSISTLNEAKITLKLMGPPIWRKLIDESKVKKPKFDAEIAEEIGEDTIKSPAFSRDLNERLKVYMGMLQFIENVERRNDDQTSNRTEPHIEILTSRGIDSDRLRFLIGGEFGGVGRKSDGVGGQDVESGAIPDQSSERQGDIQDSQQEPPDRYINGNLDRDSTWRNDTA